MSSALAFYKHTKPCKTAVETRRRSDNNTCVNNVKLPLGRRVWLKPLVR